MWTREAANIAYCLRAAGLDNMQGETDARTCCALPLHRRPLAPFPDILRQRPVWRYAAGFVGLAEICRSA